MMNPGRDLLPPQRNGRGRGDAGAILTGDPVNAFLPYNPVPVASVPAGPLAGLTMAVKDIYDVAGYPTGGGSPVRQAESPLHSQTAPLIAALLGAGAVFVGKTQTDELTFSLHGQNKHFPQPVNSRAPGRITGGSSSGSAAAAAAGLCDFAVGSDTGGSIRAPASYCGLYGIRPTHERVTLAGAMPLAPSLDTAGYFADDARIFARVAAVFLGEDGSDFTLDNPLRATDGFALLSGSEEAEALSPAEKRVAEWLGAPKSVVLASEGLESWYWAFRRIQAVEAWAIHGAWLESRNPDMTPGVRERFEFGKAVPSEAMEAARDLRVSVRLRLDEVLGRTGVLMLPTVPSIAPRSDSTAEALQSFRESALQMLCIAGLSGLPQVSLPLATLDGCPLGLSLIGPRGSDRALVRLAAEIGGGG